MTSDFKGLAEKIGVVVQGGTVSIQNVNVYQSSLQLQTGIPQNLPYSGAKEFVGRTKEIEVLHQQLQQRNHIAAVSGMGGIGKTELALQYAREHLEDYSGGICWLQARGDNLGTQVIEFAQLHLNLKVPQQLENIQLNVNQQVEWCWQNWQPSDKPVLLILDDVNNPAILRNIIKSLPSRFSILITTRQRQIDVSFSELALDVLPLENSLDLLKEIIGSERVCKEIEIAEDLCNWLGCLPLGLELIGRYLVEDPHLNLIGILNQLKTQSLNNAALDLSEEKTQEKYIMTAQRGVKAAFELTWNELSKNSLNRFNFIKIIFGEQLSITADLACLLSLFSPDIIPWELVEIVCQDLKWSYSDISETRKSLYKRHIIQLVKSDTYRIHPLIREFLCEKLEISKNKDKLKKIFSNSMALISSQIPDEPTKEIIEANSLLIPHIVEVTTSTISYLNDDNLIWPFTALSRFYEGQGFYDIAEVWAKQCVFEHQSRIGSNSINTATSIYNLAGIYWHHGVYESAESLYLNALQSYKSLLGNNAPLTMSCLNNLATVYHMQERYGEAEALYKEILGFRENFLGENHTETIASLINLASLYAEQANYSEAEKLFKKAIEKLDKSTSGESLLLATATEDLAALYYDQARYKESESLCLRALKVRKDLLGDEHPVVAMSQKNLADVYVQLGNYVEAERLCLRALEIRREFLGDTDVNVGRTLKSLGDIRQAQCQYAEAEELYKQAAEIIQNQRGDNYSYTATVWMALAECYLEQNLFSEAENLYRKALEFRQSLLGADHPNVADSLHSLAFCLYKSKKFVEAEELYLQAKTIWEGIFGAGHPDVALTIHNLSALYDAQGKLDEAVVLCNRAQAIWEETLGTDHPLYARSLDRLASIYSQQKKFCEAEALYEQALTVRQEKLGLNHPDTINTQKSLEKIRAIRVEKT
jgi:tetratricopeptide (TPR) repeat protein